ncbi:MAG: sulfatase-like hydrolase/transferase [Planctomycetes bacterium]|nr:sulfatase-like hydrolase/transferase [Planctomycetota bacterium]
MKSLPCFGSLLLLSLIGCTQEVAPAKAPNILLVLADDLGYGDPGCYNSASHIATPAIDRLAAEGMRLTDMHTPSAVCTPTRYGLLTGRYAWRSSLKSGVLGGNSPALIEPERDTIASMLGRAGYRTACVGKWHLGFGAVDPVDYSAPLRPGPLDIGFDRFFGIPASLDIPPYLYIEGDQSVQPLSTEIAGSQLARHGGGGFWRKGEISEDFVHEEVLDRILTESQDFLRAHVAAEDIAPFFLYVPLTAPHTPWLPKEGFRGSTQAGVYGDFVAQVDDTFGQLLATLEELELDEDTLVIFTSDNGAHWKKSDIERYAHLANGEWRGQKADIHEGGHRVPFVVRWPGKIPQGSTRSELFVLTDMYATLAKVSGATPQVNGGEDSVNALPVLLNEQLDAPPRDTAVHHSLNGLFAIRHGNWKYIEGVGSGGFTQIKSPGGGPGGQLYDLAKDPGEKNNLWASEPERVADLQARLNALRGQ